MTIDQELAIVYAAEIKGRKEAAIADLRTALGDPTLLAEATARKAELNDLIAKRGQGACAYSTKYWGYLNEVLP